MNNDEVIARWARNPGDPKAKGSSKTRRCEGAILKHWSTTMARFVKNDRGEIACEILDDYPSVTSRQVLFDCAYAVGRKNMPIFYVTDTSHAPNWHGANLNSFLARFNESCRLGCFNNRSGAWERHKAIYLAENHNAYCAFWDIPAPPLEATWPDEYVAETRAARKAESMKQAAETRARNIARILRDLPALAEPYNAGFIGDGHVRTVKRMVNQLDKNPDE